MIITKQRKLSSRGQKMIGRRTMLACLLGLNVALGLGMPAAAQDQDAKAPAKDPVAPEKFRVKCETSQGTFVIDVQRKWSPIGADRFHALVKAGYYDECRFFRVVPNFVVQFGMNGDPKTQKKWDVEIKDDPVVVSNKKGYVTFAKSAKPNSRTTQLFINLRDNAFLDGMQFAPFGVVSEGMDVVLKINSEYGQKPQQGQIQAQGNAYLKKEFPKLDFIKKATIVPAK